MEGFKALQRHSYLQKETHFKIENATPDDKTVWKKPNTAGWKIGGAFRVIKTSSTMVSGNEVAGWENKMYMFLANSENDFI